MLRVAIGFALAPLLVGAASSYLAIPVLFVMLVTSVFVAVPAFLLFRWRGWLSWWQVTLGGMICSVPFIALYGFSAGPYHVEIYGPANILFFASLGAAVGFLFWWIALFRNERFPTVPTPLPASTLLILPAVAIGVAIHRALTPVLVEGHIENFAEGASTPVLNSAMAMVRLQSGEMVFARVPQGLSIPLKVTDCVHMDSRQSLKLTGPAYWIITFKIGEHYHDC
jgi:hypothetical protein